MTDSHNSLPTIERIKEHRENRKKNMERPVGDKQAMAVAKYLRVTPRKARFVVDEVRGLYVTEAAAFLRFVPNRAAHYIAKVLQSAAANAVNNHGLDLTRLKLVEARVDEGPRIKRVQPRAQGRAYQILHRMSHITLIVEEGAPRVRKVTAGKTGSRAQAARSARVTPESVRAASPAQAAQEKPASDDSTISS